MSRRAPERPADFEQHAYEPVVALRKRYHTSYVRVAQWRREIGVTAAMLRADLERRFPQEKRAAPADFFTVQAGQTTRALTAHYGVSIGMITRWLREVGVERGQQRAARGKAREIARSAPRRSVTARHNPHHTLDRPHRDISVAGQAADFLRKFGPVVRCDETGIYHEHGSHWRRNTTVLTADEVIARAKRNGFTVLSFAPGAF